MVGIEGHRSIHAGDYLEETMTKFLAIAILLAQPAQASHRQDRAQMRCMVDLTQMTDAKLKRWCLKQSERMP